MKASAKAKAPPEPKRPVLNCLVIGDGVPLPEADNTARIGLGQNFIQVHGGQMTVHGSLADPAAIIELCRVHMTAPKLQPPPAAATATPAAKPSPPARKRRVE